MLKHTRCVLRLCSSLLIDGSGQRSSSLGPKAEMENAHIDIPMRKFLLLMEAYFIAGVANKLKLCLFTKEKSVTQKEKFCFIQSLETPSLLLYNMIMWKFGFGRSRVKSSYYQLTAIAFDPCIYTHFRPSLALYTLYKSIQIPLQLRIL